MNILHVYKTFLNNGFGGVEQAIFHLAKASGSNFNHTVLSLSPQSHKTGIIHSGIKNICYKENFSIASNGISFSLLRDFHDIAQQADIIHYHFPWPFADIMHLFWRIKKPAVLTYHSDIVRQQKLLLLYKPLMNRFLSSVDKIVATSPNYLASSPILQKYRNKVSVVPLGLSRDNYPPATPERLAFWRNKFGARFFLFVGVLRYYKGLHILLNAAQHTDFPVLLVGTGPLEDALKAHAKKLDLNHVHFLGQVSEEDKVALMTLCSAVIFPSHLRSEAFGITLLEGAMAGKPLISCEIGTGTSYINLNGETGIVVPPRDPVALRNAMQFVWTNPEAGVLMGQKASNRFDALFTDNLMANKYEKIYIELSRLGARTL